MNPYRLRLIILIGTVALFATGSSHAGTEVPPPRPIAGKARMSTHAVIATASRLEVIDTRSGEVIAKPGGNLERYQCFQASVAIQEVLDADPQAPIHVGQELKIRFGMERSTVSSYRQQLVGKKLIYWLSRDSALGNVHDYFYPFYGQANLTDDLDKRLEAEVALASLDAVLK